jgi:hypothetical protein
MFNTVEKKYFNGEFVSYEVTYIDNRPSASVPNNEANTDYQAILTWIAEGGVVIDNPPSE